MRILGIIPARAGSKRVPGKNIKLLAQKPLIAHTIKAAQSSRCCDELMVSTDSEEIAKIALEYQASVPWLRAAFLADDTSDVIDAVLNVLENYAKENKFFDSVLLLQATSPFRRSETIQKAVHLHQDRGLSVVSVSPAKLKISWMRTIDKQGFLAPSALLEKNCETPMVALNGSIYLATTEQLMANRSFYSSSTHALLMESEEESLDIDTPLDWALAEKIVDLYPEIFS